MSGQQRTLTVESLTVRFGGTVALDGVSFEVAPGSIHAVIGPNGAGKSSTFNVISGLYRPAAGTVRFGEEQLTGLAPHRIAAKGIGRAFQNIALVSHESVTDNIMVGRHRLMRAGFVTSGLWFPTARREEARHRARAREIGEFVGLGGLLDAPAGTLSYGGRKKVELARALASEPRLILLDEPAAGMPAHEKQEIASIVLSIRESLDISVLIVEHDMPLVMGVADRITVLDFGKRIADGTPAEIRENPAVIAAYLGELAPDETGSLQQQQKGADE